MMTNAWYIFSHVVKIEKNMEGKRLSVSILDGTIVIVIAGNTQKLS